MMFFTWEEVCKRRLARHYISKAAGSGRTVEVVREVCGVQAQIITAAELAIGARVSGVTQEDVRKELWERHSLVKTYGPRETLHLLPADELPLWMAAMQARASFYEAHPYQSIGFSPAQAEAILATIEGALDGRCLMREELTLEVGRRAGSWAEEWMASTWGSLLGPAAYRGLLCFGPSQGSKVTFVRADQWTGIDLDVWKQFDPDEALAELLRRYLTTYGPATHQDFGHWFALKPDDARRVMESISGELEEVEVEGLRAWLLSADTEGPPSPDNGSLRLLPQYDCYVIGCGPRERVVPEAARSRVRTYGRGRFEGATGLPVLLADGIVAGIWERKQHGKRLELKVEPFIELAPAQQEQLQVEANRIGQFLGTEAALSLGRLE